MTRAICIPARRCATSRSAWRRRAARRRSREFGRPEYAALIRDNPIELPLAPDRMVVAFRMWDERIGAKKGTR